MKKGKILKTLAIAGTCLCAPLLLSGCTSGNENKTDFRVFDGYIQVTKDGTTWENLVDLDTLKGLPGEDGDDGVDADVWTIGNDGYWYKNGNPTNYKAKGNDGTDGNGIKSITKDDVNSTKQKTIYIIELDNGTKYSFEVVNGLDGAKGEDGQKGEDGKDATYATYTVTYDYGRAVEFFETDKSSDEIKSTEWLTTLPQIKDSHKNLFIGWCIEGTNKLIENYDFIGGDVTLYAKFNVNEESPSGLYQNGKYVKTWSDLKNEIPNLITNDTINAKVVSEQGKTSYFDEMNTQGEIVIDESISIIGEGAFSFCDFENIYIKDGVTTIEVAAFYGCKNLNNKFNLPNSITTVDSGAFGGLWDWQYNISDYGKYVGNADNPYMILLEPTSSSFSQIHEDCRVISKHAFKGLYGMVPNVIRIPKFITKISTNTFVNCNSLTTIIIDSYVLEEIELGAFEGCPNLTNIFLAKNRDELWQNATINDETIKSATIYYYSEQEPSTEGNYWHYDTDGKTPIIWEATE